MFYFLVGLFALAFLAWVAGFQFNAKETKPGFMKQIWSASGARAQETPPPGSTGSYLNSEGGQERMRQIIEDTKERQEQLQQQQKDRMQDQMQRLKDMQR